MRVLHSFSFITLLFLFSVHVLAQQGAICSALIPCKIGCCSKDGSCGFTPAHCGDGCQGNCDAKAECGQYAKKEDFDCPINVCCSKYGFCGVTKDFCGSGCQANSKGGGCGEPNRPTCGSNTDPLTYKKRVGYFELFTQGRSCGVKEPEDIPLGPFTHINLAFVNFGADFELIDDSPDWVRRMVLRKLKYPALKISIAVGGWAFNDIPTDKYFSNMASTRANRMKFINSVVRYLRSYALDGIDIDWEYPVAADRGGTKEDAANYVSLLKELREAFDRENTSWEISIAVPSSYWYLRGFDLPGLQQYVDHFNLMSYDIHGMWDLENKWTGPYLKGHTDWSQVELGLDLLWRNGVKPNKVVLGFAFYGGIPGSCTDTAGVLTYEEIASRNSTLDVGTFYDAENTVKYNVFGGDQWVSYDDAQSFRDKLDRLSRRCLSGLMIWAVDQDTSEWDAMGALFGDYSALELDGLQSGNKDKLADLFGQYNGQNCFVTSVCTDGTSGQQGPDQVCPSGFTSVTTAHNPLQRGGFKRRGACADGWWRHICCPSKSMPKNCEWNGGPRSPVSQGIHFCAGSCGDGKFQLNQDNYLSATGGGVCIVGSRKLCCDSTALFNQCKWSPCQGPTREWPKCPDDTERLTFRYNRPSGTGTCNEEYKSPDGSVGSPIVDVFKSALCCPKGKSFSNCGWSNSYDAQPAPGEILEVKTPEQLCAPTPCKKGQIQVADAVNPPEPKDTTLIKSGGCKAFSLPPGFDPRFPFCCDPPSTFSKDWPVDPKKLWAIAFANPDTDSAVWDYSDNYDFNDKDRSRSSDGEIDGEDAYGFMMLNGPEEALDDKFSTSQTVVRRTVAVPKVKRQIVTSNHTLIGKVFEHPEEIFHVYCSYPPGSTQCERVFKGGVEDTIIKLPDHVGAGPFARIVSMKTVRDFELPQHHLQHRSDDNLHENPLYEVKIDYNFHLARQDRGQINIRVDFTNLLGYWDQMTDEKVSRIKRSYNYEGFDMHKFHQRVRRGQEATKKLKKRGTVVRTGKVPMELVPRDVNDIKTSLSDGTLQKRWFGTFVNWLKRITTFSGSEVGRFPLDWADTIKLFKARFGCPGRTYYASLDVDLEASIEMQAMYAYYYSATIIPFPKKPDMYFYFGMEPEAYLGISLKGYAQLRASTQRRRIIDTIGFPGLAIPGIAAVGPTLDVDGEIRGKLSIAGNVRAGAQIKLGKAEAYWPQSDEAVKQFDKMDVQIKGKPIIPEEDMVRPVFEAGVEVNAEIDVIIRPEANIGIQIGGGKLTGGKTAVSARVTAFLEGVLALRAKGTLNVVKKTFDYTYGAYLYYNLGFEATVNILAGWINWASAPRYAYNPAKQVDIYKQSGSIQMGTTAQARSVDNQGSSSNNSMEHLYSNSTVLNDTSENSGGLSLFKRAPTSDGDTNPQAPTFSQDISCPNKDSATWTIPELRFNCASIPPRSVGGIPFASTCQVWSRLPGWPYVWTHDADGPEFSRASDSRTWQRREAACRDERNECAQDRATAQKAAKILVDQRQFDFQCDETPMASVEEGGSFQPARTAVCIPAIDNNHAGQCTKILSGLRSNVGRMHGKSKKKVDDRTSAWVKWDTSDNKFWFGAGEIRGEAVQEVVEYPNRMPDPRNAQASKDTMAYMHRRNYTYNMINDGAQSSNWFDAIGKRFVSGGSRNYQFQTSDYNSILCAVNIFGQTEYYDFVVQAGSPKYNALCRRDRRAGTGSWEYYSISTCWVDFGTGATKRSDTGSISTDYWHAENVTIVGDPEDDWVVPVYVGPKGSIDIETGSNITRDTEDSTIGDENVRIEASLDHVS